VAEHRDPGLEAVRRLELLGNVLSHSSEPHPPCLVQRSHEVMTCSGSSGLARIFVPSRHHHDAEAGAAGVAALQVSATTARSAGSSGTRIASAPPANPGMGGDPPDVPPHHLHHETRL
jgi:hypothetical protein